MTTNGHLIAVVVVIPAPAGDAINDARGRYEPTAGKLPPHITVLPPVDVDDHALSAVEGHLGDVALRTTPFDVRLRGTATFRPRSPVVYLAVAEGVAELARLEAAVRSGDLAAESRFPYHPHVTVAHRVPDEVLDAAFSDLADFDARVRVDSFGLYEHRGRSWEHVREFPLLGQA